MTPGVLHGRALLETLDIRGNERPPLRRAGPDMPADLHPVGIVESSARDAARSRSPFRSPGNRSAASRTELHAQPALAFAGAMLICRERSAREFNLLYLEEDRLGKSAPGTPLAERAVADRCQHRITDGSIANAAAHAATLVDITHGLSSRTRTIDQVCPNTHEQCSPTPDFPAGDFCLTAAT
jgi:hypothetical protein